MKSVNIKLETIEDIRNFVGILAKYSCDLDLKSGRYTVDARSLMGIFALNWDKPVELVVHSGDDAVADAVFADIKAWVI